MKIIRFRILLVLLIDILLIVICGINIIAISEKANIPEIINNDVIIDKDFKPFLLKGDSILTINRKVVKDRYEIEFLCDNLKINDTIELTFQRNGDRIIQKIQLVPYYNNNYLTIVTFIGFLFFLLAIYVFLKKQVADFRIVFHWLFVSAALMIMLTCGSIAFYRIETAFAMRVLFDFSLLATPAAFVHFSLIFPVQRIKKLNYFMLILYTLIFIIILILAPQQWDYLTTSSLPTFQEYVTWHEDYLKNFIIPSLVFVLVSFVYSYIKAGEESERRKLRWVFVGATFGPLVYVVAYQLPKKIFGAPFISESIMLISIMITLVFFFIAVVRYRIVDINFLINRSVVYGIVIGFALALFAGIISLANIFVGRTWNEPSLPVAVIASVIIALIFQPLKSRIQLLIDRRFFKIKYNFKTVQNDFMNKIKDCITYKEVSNLVYKSVNEIIPVESYAFLSVNNKLEVLFSEKVSIERSSEEILYDVAMKNRDKLPCSRKSSLEEGIDYFEDENILNKLNSELILFSYSKEKELINIILLGKKKSHFRFTFEDLSILRLFNHAAGNALQRIRLQQHLILQQEETKKLEELSQLKSYFVSSVSHELKTPLTSIRMFAEILEMKPDLPNDKKREYTEIIQGECDRLNRLINNVLDFSKIEKGTKKYKFIKTDLWNILEDVLKSLNYQLKLKKFKFGIECKEMDCKIKGDPDALSEVFINIITNAMKYSLEKKDIFIKGYEKDNYICIEVTDKGIGISGEDIDKIFDPYYRSRDENVASSGGTGIGLSLVKNIMDAHNGKTEVQSQPGKGSSFILCFPKEAS
ncbi:ATP-binding protein [Bacteroidota bacterium]